MSKSAVITGATAGIGLELAKLFAKEKYDLILIARNEAKLKEISESFKKQWGIKVISIARDLSIPDNAYEIYNDVKKLYPEKTDVLINNAGFGDLGEFVNSDLMNDVNMVNLNITSLMVLTKLFLKDMVNSDSGKILNVASTAAFQPGPFMAIYYASKAFVLSFSEAVSEELINTNVTLSVLCPGPTVTDFQERAGIENTKMVSRKYAVMTAEEVAEIAFRDLMKDKRIIVPGMLNKIGIQLVRFLPRKFITKFVKSLHKK
ncbi:MAG TPA: SDR family oxidoreductase [Ignavibacteria bacterium]|nr:SDR family oxidoreductase [Ignavibacteria bacterium]